MMGWVKWQETFRHRHGFLFIPTPLFVSFPAHAVSKWDRTQTVYLSITQQLRLFAFESRAEFSVKYIPHRKWLFYLLVAQNEQTCCIDKAADCVLSKGLLTQENRGGEREQVRCAAQGVIFCFWIGFLFFFALRLYFLESLSHSEATSCSFWLASFERRNKTLKNKVEFLCWSFCLKKAWHRIISSSFSQHMLTFFEVAGSQRFWFQSGCVLWFGAAREEEDKAFPLLAVGDSVWDPRDSPPALLFAPFEPHKSSGLPAFPRHRPKHSLLARTGVCVWWEAARWRGGRLTVCFLLGTVWFARPFGLWFEHGCDIRSRAIPTRSPPRPNCDPVSICVLLIYLKWKSSRTVATLVGFSLNLCYSFGALKCCHVLFFLWFSRGGLSSQMAAALKAF